eukprot:589860-Amphidinium_carterae.1
MVERVVRLNEVLWCSQLLSRCLSIVLLGDGKANGWIHTEHRRYKSCGGEGVSYTTEYAHACSHPVCAACRERATPACSTERTIEWVECLRMLLDFKPCRKRKVLLQLAVKRPNLSHH